MYVYLNKIKKIMKFDIYFFLEIYNLKVMDHRTLKTIYKKLYINNLLSNTIVTHNMRCLRSNGKTNLLSLFFLNSMFYYYFFSFLICCTARGCAHWCTI